MSETIVSETENNFSTIGLLNSNQNRITKREVHKGKSLEKPSSSRKHNLIGSNATIAIGSRVRGQCEIYVNDMRVKLAVNSFCYPDVVIVQGDPDDQMRNFCGRIILAYPTLKIRIIKSIS